MIHVSEGYGVLVCVCVCGCVCAGVRAHCAGIDIVHTCVCVCVKVWLCVRDVYVYAHIVKNSVTMCSAQFTKACSRSLPNIDEYSTYNISVI